jgi:hypothetical protein
MAKLAREGAETLYQYLVYVFKMFSPAMGLGIIHNSIHDFGCLLEDGGKIARFKMQRPRGSNKGVV